MSAYIYFTEEQKLRAGSVDLAEFLLRRGEKLIHSGNDRRLASDKSVTVRGNEWYDHAAERGGNSVSFVREFYGYNYPDAVSLLLGGEQGKLYQPAEKKQSPQERKSFAMPNANSDMRRVYAYLLKRRYIDRDVLTHFARAKTIFEDAVHHNAVFVGCDENGVPRHAHQKSTNSLGGSFRINVEGSDPAYSFHHVGQSLSDSTSDKLYVFEAPIDMLSFISLYQKDWERHSYVSLCGVSEHAMLKMLEIYPQLQSVVLCLDHDEAGIESTQRLRDVLTEKGYSAIGVIQPTHKDFNEDIKALHGVEAAPAEEHPQLAVCGGVFAQITGKMQTTKADCSLKGLHILFEQIQIHLHAGRFNAADQCLEGMAAVSLLLAQKQGRHMEQNAPGGQLIAELKSGFKPYQNRGKLQSRLDDIKQELICIDALQGVLAESQKEQLLGSYKTLALTCAKALILSEAERQKLEPLQAPEMGMTM